MIRQQIPDRPSEIVAAVLASLSENDVVAFERLTAAPPEQCLPLEDEMAALGDSLIGYVDPDQPPIYQYAVTTEGARYVSPGWARVMLYDVSDGTRVLSREPRSAYGAYVAFIAELDDWRFVKIDAPSFPVEHLPSELCWRHIDADRP